LRNREFDFNTIKKNHQQKVKELKADIENHKELKFVNSKYFRNQLYGGIGIIGIIFLLINNRGELHDNDNFQLYRILFILAFSLIAVLTAKWNFNRFKKKKEKTIENKIILLKRISLPKEIR